MNYSSSIGPNFLNNIGTLSYNNKNRDNDFKIGQNNNSPFFKESGNRIDAITSISRTTNFPSKNSYIYNPKYNHYDTNKYSNLSQTYGISNNYNYYEFPSQYSYQKHLSTSVLTGSDFIYDNYLDKKKYNNNYNYVIM